MYRCAKLKNQSHKNASNYFSAWRGGNSSVAGIWHTSYAAASILISWVLGRQKSFFNRCEVEAAKEDMQTGQLTAPLVKIHVYVHAYILYYATTPTFPIHHPTHSNPQWLAEKRGRAGGAYGVGG